MNQEFNDTIDLTVKASKADASVTSRINHTVKGMLAGEYGRNVQQAPTNTDETERLFFIDEIMVGDQVCLSLMNSTTSAPYGDTVADLMDFASSGDEKTHEADDGDNRGEGAKQSAAKFNPTGIETLVRSGPNYTFTQLVRNSTSKRYGLRNLGENGRRARWSDAPPTAEELARLQRVPENLDVWMTTFRGMGPSHNTFADPYGCGETNGFLDELLGRFYSFDCPKPAKVIVTRLDGTQPSIKFLREYLDAHHVYDDLVEIDHPEVKAIRYTMINGRSSLHKPGVALVHRGERYSRIEGSQWSKMCGEFGIMGAANSSRVYISIIMHDEIRNDSERRELIDHTNSILTSREFDTLVVNNGPDWFLKLSHVQSSGEDDIQGFLDEIAATLSTVQVSNSGDGLRVLQGGGEELLPTDKTPRGRTDSGTTTRGSNLGGGSSNAERKDRAPTRSGRQNAVLIAPVVKWVGEKAGETIGIAGRAATYTRASNTLWLNEDHHILHDLVNGIMMTHEFAKGTGDDGRILLLRSAKILIGKSVGEQFIYLQHDKAKTSCTFTPSELEMAMSPASLTSLVRQVAMNKDTAYYGIYKPKRDKLKTIQLRENAKKEQRLQAMDYELTEAA